MRHLSVRRGFAFVWPARLGKVPAPIGLNLERGKSVLRDAIAETRRIASLLAKIGTKDAIVRSRTIGGTRRRRNHEACLDPNADGLHRPARLGGVQVDRR